MNNKEFLKKALIEMDKVKKRELYSIKKDPMYKRPFSVLKYNLENIFLIRSKFHSLSRVELKNRTDNDIALDLKNYVNNLNVLTNNDFIKNKSILKEVLENLEVLLILCELSGEI